MPAKFKALLDILIPQILKALNLGGLWGWLGKLAMQYGGQALYDLVSDMIRKMKRSSEQKVAEQKKDEVINNPDHSAEEAGKAYEDYYNSGRN